MQSKGLIVLVITIGVFLLANCQQNEKITEQQKKEQQAKQAALVKGGLLFDNRCAGCHSGMMAKAPGFESLKLQTKEALLATLRTGVMRFQAASSTKEEQELIVDFITANQKAIPEISAGICEEATTDLAMTPNSVSDWGMGLENLRFSENQQIHAKNVADLKLSWAFAFPNASRARSQPTILGNTLFTASQHGTVYALDRATGCIRWTFQADNEIRSALTIGYDENKQANRLYFSDFHAQVYALDLNTRKLAWKIKADAHPAATITGSLSLYKDRLIVPISSLEIVSAIDTAYECCTFRGAVMAIDAEDGQEIWKTLTISETPKPSGKNKMGVTILAPSGAPVWSRPTIDAKREMVYVGTGENYTRPTSGTSDAIIAMSLATGEIQWVQQCIPKDAWNGACSIPNHPNCPDNTGPDADFGAPPMLVTSAGKDLLIAGQKSGDVYALDPDNKGAIVWQKVVGRGGIMGGVHFGMATDKSTLYVPINDRGTYQLHEDKAPSPGVHALDVWTGKELWSTIEKNRCGDVKWGCGPGISGPITANSSLVFAGALDGVLKAYNAKNGKELWAYDTQRDFEAVNGVPAYGGSIDSDGPILVDNQLFINSGYAKFNEKAGNVLLAFEVQ